MIGVTVCNMDNQSLEPVGEAWRYDKDYHTLSDFLGVNIYDRNDSDVHDKVAYLQESSGGKDMNKVLLEVSKLRKSLGLQFIGKPLVKELYQTMRLRQNNTQPLPVKDDTKPLIKKERKTVDYGIKDLMTQAPIQKAIAKQQQVIQKTITSSIQNTMQESVRDIINRTINDKSLIQGALNSALKGAVK